MIECDLEAEDEVTTIRPKILVACGTIDAESDRIAYRSLLPKT